MKYILKLWRRFVYHTRLVHKYMYLLLFLLLAEILIVTIYIRPNTVRLMNAQAEDATNQFLESYVSNIGYRLSNYNKLLEALAGNETIRLRLSHETLAEIDYSSLDVEIRNTLSNQFPYGFYDMAFYPANGCSSGVTYLIQDPEEVTGECREKMDEKYYRRYFAHEFGRFNTQILSVLYPIYGINEREVVCVMRLSLSPKYVFKAGKGMEEEQSQQVFIIDSDGESVYGSAFPDMEEYLDYIRQYKDEWYSIYDVAPFEGKTGKYLTSTYSAGGFRAVYYISYEKTMAEVEAFQQVLFTGLLVLTLITLGVGLALSWNVERRFSKVIGKIQSVSEGKLEVEDAGTATDEIGIFDSSFTEMVRRTKVLIAKNYVSEMKKKDAQLLALQAQIQPHFLFNSLEIINSLVEIGRYDTACEVNVRLSSLLRYSINHNSSGMVTLQDEIVYMKDYLYIQNLRFQDRYRLHEKVEEDCLELPMMKLVLQPLVENSIKHGFPKAKDGNIWLHVYRKESWLIIELRDDGNGMEETEFENLLEKLQKDPGEDFQKQKNSIGIINIHDRLRLKYGEAYSIQIETAPGQGMRTILSLPVSEESVLDFEE